MKRPSSKWARQYRRKLVRGVRGSSRRMKPGELKRGGAIL